MKANAVSETLISKLNPFVMQLVFVVEIAPLTISKYLIHDMGSSYSQHHHLSTVDLYHGQREEDGTK